MDYNVTVELDAVLTDEAVDEVLEALGTAGLHPVVHGSQFDTSAVTVTVEEFEDLWDAGAYAVERVGNAVPARVRAYAAMSTEDYDALGDSGSDVLSVPQAADLLGVSEQRVRQLLVEGKLAGDKVGRDWVVNARSVADRVAGRT